MAEIDIEKIIKVVRKCAEVNGYSDHLDEALIEAGLVDSDTYNGYITVKVPVKDFAYVGDITKLGENSEVKVAAAISLAGKTVVKSTTDVTIDSISLKGEKEPAVPDDKHWRYVSEYDGQVVHYFDNPDNKTNHYNYAACGVYRFGSLPKTSKRGTGRKCKGCAKSKG